MTEVIDGAMKAPHGLEKHQLHKHTHAFFSILHTKPLALSPLFRTFCIIWDLSAVAGIPLSVPSLERIPFYIM